MPAAAEFGHFRRQLAKMKGAYGFLTASTKIRTAAQARRGRADRLHANTIRDIARKIDIVLDTLGDETQERSLVSFEKAAFLFR